MTRAPRAEASKLRHTESLAKARLAAATAKSTIQPPKSYFGSGMFRQPSMNESTTKNMNKYDLKRVVRPSNYFWIEFHKTGNMSNKGINWGKVIYNEDERKLIFFDQKVVRVPEAIYNLFHGRVKILDLSCNRISSLDALQYFEEMEELILDNNMITDDVVFPPNSPNLRVLSLNNNRIKDLNKLLKKVKRSFPHLEYLSLLGNTACPYFFLNFDFDSYYEYRIHVISQLKNLRFLDTRQVSLTERKLAKNKKMNIPESSTAPASLDYNDCIESTTNGNTQPSSLSGLARFFPISWLRREPKVYNPLPDSKERQPRAAYGKLNYKYIGNESEALTFIFQKRLCILIFTILKKLLYLLVQPVDVAALMLKVFLCGKHDITIFLHKDNNVYLVRQSIAFHNFDKYNTLEIE
uniref:CSON002399 protein n=1 Tax=Culicoides sonorensis TaxID=179676 RepID=A0A336LIJ0_CULSO